MINQQLAAIRARCKAATFGPWMIGTGYKPGIRTRDCREGSHWTIVTGSGICKANDSREANAEFIAHAREDVPALLAEVDRLRDLLRRADELIHDLEEQLPPDREC